MNAWSVLLDVVLLLGTALVLGAVAVRLRQSPLVGYLVAGALLGGPGSLQVVESGRDIEAVAELGVALLLFGLGLEFSWQRLRGLGGRLLAAGAAQVVATLGLVTGAGWAFGYPPAESAVVGAMVSLSSTAAVLRVLMDRGEIDSLHGRGAVAVLLVQDMAVVPLALFVSLLGSSGSAGNVAAEGGRVIGTVALLVAGLWAASRLAVWGLGTGLLARNRELGALLAVVVGLGSAWAAHAAKTSPALGAFVAGMLLGSSPFASQVRADIASLRVVLLTLFFGAAGMVADPLWIARNAHLVLSIVFGVAVAKTAVVWALLRVLGRPGGIAATTGLCLAQIGEFAFVLGAVGTASGALSEETSRAVVSAAITSLFLTPYMVAAAPAFGAWVERLGGRRVPAGRTARGETVVADVVIIGFGPAGRAVAEALVGRELRVAVIDLNPKARDLAAGLGFHGETGDACHPDVLEHAGVAGAKVVVVTLPSPRAAVGVIQNVRSLAPAARIVARSRYQIYAKDYAGAGAHLVVDEERRVGEGLAEGVLQELSPSSGPGEPREGA